LTYRFISFSLRRDSWVMRLPYIDMTASSLGKPPSPEVSLMLLAIGEIPRAHEVFQHGALFELVFDAVRMVRTGHFEKFLKVLVRLPHMVLQISFGDRDILLIGVIRFLVMVVAIAGRNWDS
jgi:hypothetical protein